MTTKGETAKLKYFIRYNCIDIMKEVFTVKLSEVYSSSYEINRNTVFHVSFCIKFTYNYKNFWREIAKNIVFLLSLRENDKFYLTFFINFLLRT